MKKVLFEIIFFLSELFAKLLFKKDAVYIFGTGLVYGPKNNGQSPGRVRR